MKVEDITWVGLTTWWTSEQERHLSVGHSLLSQIIVNDDGVLSVVSEPFAKGELVNDLKLNHILNLPHGTSL